MLPVRLFTCVVQSSDKVESLLGHVIALACKISRDKRFLGCILGQTGIAQHRIGDTVGHVLAAFHDLGKRFLVAILCGDYTITQLFYCATSRQLPIRPN
jgi:hypothetical protein